MEAQSSRSCSRSPGCAPIILFTCKMQLSSDKDLNTLCQMKSLFFFHYFEGPWGEKALFLNSNPSSARFLFSVTFAASGFKHANI